MDKSLLTKRNVKNTPFRKVTLVKVSKIKSLRITKAVSTDLRCMFTRAVSPRLIKLVHLKFSKKKLIEMNLSPQLLF